MTAGAAFCVSADGTVADGVGAQHPEHGSASVLDYIPQLPARGRCFCDALPVADRLDTAGPTDAVGVRRGRFSARYRADDRSGRPIANQAIYPLSFSAAAPGPGASIYLSDPGIRQVAAFFTSKGLAALKEEDRAETWYADWVEYQAKHRLYAGVLSPKAYSSHGCQLDLLRLTRFWESFAYFSPAHAYSLHVSFLGLFPLLRSDNEALKREAVAKLEAGGLFAFAVSEKGHGSDLLGNEFTVADAGPGG